MQRRSTQPSGIGMALQQHGHAHHVNDTAIATGEVRPLAPRGNRGRSVSEARVFSQLRASSPLERSSAITFDCTGCSDIPPLNTSQDGIFKDFCRGQPPRQSFLSEDGATPPRLRMARRSTLADKPELDAQLEALMVKRKDEMFLPLNFSTVFLFNQYLNGSKPLVHIYCLFKGLLIDSETNEIPASIFITALEKIGPYCEHLAVVAPFHTIEFGRLSDCETRNSEPGNDWYKILERVPNVRNITFEDQTETPTAPTRETFYSLNAALLKNTTINKYVKLKNNVLPQVIFDFHREFHSRQRPSDSPDSLGCASTPLTMVGSDMFYADGAEDFGLLEDDNVFGEADDIHTKEEWAKQELHG